MRQNAEAVCNLGEKLERFGSERAKLRFIIAAPITRTALVQNKLVSRSYAPNRGR